MDGKYGSKGSVFKLQATSPDWASPKSHCVIERKHTEAEPAWVL